MSHANITFKGRLSRAVASLLIPHGFPGCSILLRNGYKLLGKPPCGPLVVETRHGFSMMVDPRRNKGLEGSIYFNGSYEAGTIAVITQVLRQGDVFIDAGANIGLMSLAAAQAVGPIGRVHAFEPVPTVNRALRQNLALNKCSSVIVHDVALGSAVETLTIYEKPSISHGSATFVKPDTSDGLISHQASVITLDKFLAENEPKSIRMIKADIEGWELEMLRGAANLLAKPDAPALCVEYSKSYSPTGEKVIDVYDYVKSVNHYECFKLKWGKETCSPLIPIRNTPELPRHDNIFFFLSAHIKEIGSRLFA